MAEYEKYRVLQEDLKNLQKQWEEQAQMIETLQRTDYEQTTSQYEAKLKSRTQDVNEVIECYEKFILDREEELNLLSI